MKYNLFGTTRYINSLRVCMLLLKLYLDISSESGY